MHLLIVTSDFYTDVSENLLAGALAELSKHNYTYHKISVPGSLEIPAVISFASDLAAYDAFIALGTIIKGETIHHEVIAMETARALSDLAINMNLAVGNGILTTNNRRQALRRSSINEHDKGGHAARAAIKMAKIRNKFNEIKNV